MPIIIITSISFKSCNYNNIIKTVFLWLNKQRIILNLTVLYIIIIVPCVLPCTSPQFIHIEQTIILLLLVVFFSKEIQYPKSSGVVIFILETKRDVL